MSDTIQQLKVLLARKVHELEKIEFKWENDLDSHKKRFLDASKLEVQSLRTLVGTMEIKNRIYEEVEEFEQLKSEMGDLGFEI